MMKTKIYIVVIALLSLIVVSCNTESTNNKELDEHGHSDGDEEEHEEHEEGIVTLSKKQQNSLMLKMGSFEMRNLTTVIKINGVVEVPPESMAGVTAIIGGNVKRISVFQGDKVRKGQTLAVLEHPDYISLQEDFAMIANNLDYLKQEYERQKELFENEVGAGKNYQKAKADYHIAKVKYEGLKSRLLLLGLSPSKVKDGQISNTINIVAPIAGYVNEVNIKVGVYVDAKTELLEISDNAKLHADFQVYEKDVHLLKVGQKIHLTVANRYDKEYDAIIFAIGKEFNRDSRSVNIHANIESDTEGLIPGMFITGHLHTNKDYVKTLPNDAVVTEGSKSFIFILEHEDGDHAEYKKIEIIKGKSNEAYTQINLLEELPENTRVVLNNAYYLLADINKDELEHEH